LIRLKTLQEGKNNGDISERLDDLRSLTAQTIEELRRLAMDLRPSALDSLGIVPALQWYIQQCAERTGLDIQFRGPDKFERLPLETEFDPVPGSSRGHHQRHPAWEGSEH